MVHPKRPRGPNQLAKRCIDIATGETPDRDPTPEEESEDPAAVFRAVLSEGIRIKKLFDALIHEAPSLTHPEWKSISGHRFGTGISSSATRLNVRT
jgi:hypothetical protein